LAAVKHVGKHVSGFLEPCARDSTAAAAVDKTAVAKALIFDAKTSETSVICAYFTVYWLVLEKTAR
jgi:hypothetical protein